MSSAEKFAWAKQHKSIPAFRSVQTQVRMGQASRHRFQKPTSSWSGQEQWAKEIEFSPIGHPVVDQLFGITRGGELRHRIGHRWAGSSVSQYEPPPDTHSDPQPDRTALKSKFAAFKSRLEAHKTTAQVSRDPPRKVARAGSLGTDEESQKEARDRDDVACNAGMQNPAAVAKRWPSLTEAMHFVRSTLLRAMQVTEDLRDFPHGGRSHPDTESTFRIFDLQVKGDGGRDIWHDGT